MKKFKTNKSSDINEQWLEIDHCPSCKSLEKKNRGQLPLDFYHTAGKKVTISLPERGIFLYECQKCGLLYKDLIPSRKLIYELISAEPEAVWFDGYKYEDEIGLIDSLLDGQNSYSLLDIGSSHGELIKASLNHHQGKRSALDITRYPSLSITSDGEFIEGFLDSSNLIWSGSQYNIVTAFDVLEHLYDPIVSFSNLGKFLKEDGFIIIETGDSNQYWYSKDDISLWQYICFFEHHMIWNYRSIEYQAKKNGFEIISYVNKQHKCVEKNWILKIKNFLLLSVYLASKTAYKIIAKRMNKKNLQPPNFFVKDHCQVILKKVEKTK